MSTLVCPDRTLTGTLFKRIPDKRVALQVGRKFGSWNVQQECPPSVFGGIAPICPLVGLIDERADGRVSMNDTQI